MNSFIGIDFDGIVLPAEKFARIFSGGISSSGIFRSYKIHNILSDPGCKNIICWLKKGEGRDFELIGDWPSSVDYYIDEKFEIRLARGLFESSILFDYADHRVMRIGLGCGLGQSHALSLAKPFDVLGLLTNQIDIAMDYCLVDIGYFYKKIKLAQLDVNNAFAYEAYNMCQRLLEEVIDFSKKDGSVEALEKLISEFLAKRGIGSFVE